MQPGGAIQITRQRVTGTGRLPPLAPPVHAPTASTPSSREVRPVWIDAKSGWLDTPIYDGARLVAGQSIAGPAVVDEATTTVLVGAGDVLTVDAAGNYALALAPAATDGAGGSDACEGTAMRAGEASRV
jgi:N-methylhydantoinase A